MNLYLIKCDYVIHEEWMKSLHLDLDLIPSKDGCLFLREGIHLYPCLDLNLFQMILKGESIPVPYNNRYLPMIDAIDINANDICYFFVLLFVPIRYRSNLLVLDVSITCPELDLYCTIVVIFFV